MTTTPRRQQQEATVRVFYPPDSPERREWQVPAEVYKVGQAKAWIEQRLRGEAEAKVRVEREADQVIASEFQSIKQGMSQLKGLRSQIGLLEQTVASYEAADAARQQELKAVRSAADEAIGIGTNAVATTRDLSLATTGAADLLDRLRTTADQLETRLERAFADCDRKVEELEALAKQQGQTIRNQQAAFQTVVAKLEDKISELDSTASKADVMAQNAYTTATAATRANQHGNDVQTAADTAALEALRSWEESSDTATMRKLIGTDARSLDHLATALQSMKDQSQDIGGTSVQDAAVIAERLIDRIRQAQEFKDGFATEYAYDPDMPGGNGKAAKSGSAKGRGGPKPLLY